MKQYQNDDDQNVLAKSRNRWQHVGAKRICMCTAHCAELASQRNTVTIIIWVISQIKADCGTLEGDVRHCAIHGLIA